MIVRAWRPASDESALPSKGCRHPDSAGFIAGAAGSAAMSKARELALAQRQQGLLQQSAALRSSLALQLRPWQPGLRVADQVRAAWGWLRAHPEWVVGAGLVVVLLRPGRALRWGMRLWSGVRLWQQIRRQLQALP